MVVIEFGSTIENSVSPRQQINQNKCLLHFANVQYESGINTVEPVQTPDKFK